MATDLDEYFDHVLYFADPDLRRIDDGPVARWLGWWQRAADALIDSDDPLLHLSARQGFAVNTDQLRAAGVSRATTRARLANGRWISPRTGALTPLDLSSEAPWLDLGRRVSTARAGRDVARRRTRAVAATASALFNRGHVISGRSAALLHGLPTFREPDRPILTAPARTTLGRRHGAVLARGAALTGADTASWFGADVTTVARTVVDVGRLDRWDGLFAADAALHAQMATRAELVSAVGRARGWPGVRQAREIVDLADALFESPLESLTRIRLHDDGFPAPQLQATIAVPGRATSYRVDFLWPEHRLVLEADGRVKYSGDALWREKEREAELRACGYRVERVRWVDLTTGWPRTRIRLRALLTRT